MPWLSSPSLAGGWSGLADSFAIVRIRVLNLYPVICTLLTEGEMENARR